MKNDTIFKIKKWKKFENVNTVKKKYILTKRKNNSQTEIYFTYMTTTIISNQISNV